jgi:hypothetical protein
MRYPKRLKHFTGGGLAGIAGAIATVAVGGFAIGALSVGSLAIGGLGIGRARIKSLQIEDLAVKHLRAADASVAEELTLRGSDASLKLPS